MSRASCGGRAIRVALPFSVSALLVALAFSSGGLPPTIVDLVPPARGGNVSLPAGDGAPGLQWVPELAFDGTNYLVVWMDQRSGDWDIYGARVTPGGAVLDPGGIAISTAAWAKTRPWLPSTARTTSWSGRTSVTHWNATSTVPVSARAGGRDARRPARAAHGRTELAGRGHDSAWCGQGAPRRRDAIRGR
jgi:hypothetical protein